jgi:hypothetical protein
MPSFICLHKNRIKRRCKPKILRLRDEKRQPELIGGWHIASKKDTQGRWECRFVIGGLDLPVLTRQALVKMLYRKSLTRPERELEKSWLAINMFM